MKILIFDAPDGIHAGLARALIAEGAEVDVDTTTDHSSMRAMRHSAVAAKPDAIVLAGGWDDVSACETDPDRAFRRNAEDPIHVAAAARELGAIAILLSPAEVYAQRGGPFTESDEPQATSVWATTRLRGEVLLKRAAPTAIVLRTGPIVSDGKIRGPIEIADKGLADPIAAPDLAHAIFRLVGVRASGTFHLSGPEGAERPTRAELAKLMNVRPSATKAKLGRSPLLLGEKIRPFLLRPPGPWRDSLVREEPKLGHKHEVKRVDKPWGHEIIWAHSDRYVGKLLFIKAGERLSLQYHEKKDETVYILSGKMVFEAGPRDQPREDIIMKPGDSYRITPHTVHRMIALEDTQVLEASTPELDDVVRLEDKYGRQGTSAP